MSEKVSPAKLSYGYAFAVLASLGIGLATNSLNPTQARALKTEGAEPTHHGHGSRFENQTKTEKHTSQVNIVQIQSDSVETQSPRAGPSKTDDSTPVLRFTASTLVVPQRDLTEQRFTWILPQGVRVANTSVTSEDAQLHGRIPALHAGQSWPLRIDVEWDLNAQGEQMRDLKAPLVLHVYREVNGQAIGQLSQFDLPMGEARRNNSSAEPGSPGRPNDSRRDGLSR